MKTPVRRWSTTLALIAGAVCACSTTPASTQARHPQEVVAPEAGAQAQRLRLPFDAYNFSPAEVMTLDVAEDLLVRDCMHALGRSWQALPGPAEKESAPPHRRRYGVIEPRIADVFGYHAPPDRPAVIARKTNDLARTTESPPNVREAAKRCLGQARTRMSAGAPQADAAFFNRTIFATFDASQRDVKVTQAFRTWSTCMAGEGFHYPDPLAAVTDKRWSTANPSAREIRAAQTDVRCKERTGLVSIWAEAETRIQNAAIRAHPKEFQALRAVKMRQLETARQIIART
ncbi:hypothetical protein ACFWY5_28310 [Nonomuraea sp. NPDC059007]|uniref:hypothetical protein n=1 Tax=Nonomuraea sp. NPDC059007 TaxID=3346692 RepID=UPI003687A9EB